MEVPYVSNICQTDPQAMRRAQHKIDPARFLIYTFHIGTV